MAYKLTTMTAVADLTGSRSNPTAAFNAVRDNYYIFVCSTTVSPVTAVTSTNGITFTLLASTGLSSAWGGFCKGPAPVNSGTITFTMLAGKISYSVEEINGAKEVPVATWVANAVTTAINIPAPAPEDVVYMAASGTGQIVDVEEGWQKVTDLGSASSRSLVTAHEKGHNPTAGIVGNVKTPNILAIEFKPDFASGKAPGM